jgi:hypothetical protein
VVRAHLLERRFGGFVLRARKAPELAVVPVQDGVRGALADREPQGQEPQLRCTECVQPLQPLVLASGAHVRSLVGFCAIPVFIVRNMRMVVVCAHSACRQS